MLQWVDFSHNNDETFLFYYFFGQMVHWEVVDKEKAEVKTTIRLRQYYPRII